MKLSEFKKQLKQLEEELLDEYNLTDKEVEVVTYDDMGFEEPYFSESPVSILEIKGVKRDKYIYIT